MNYDPSNTILAGEDPLELLRRVRHRVVTMHASDRYLAEGTLEDLRREESSVGYAKRLRHGEIGKGMNDYDAIFAELQGGGLRRVDQHRGRRRGDGPAEAQRRVPAREDAPLLARGVGAGERRQGARRVVSGTLSRGPGLRRGRKSWYGPSSFQGS